MAIPKCPSIIEELTRALKSAAMRGVDGALSAKIPSIESIDMTTTTNATDAPPPEAQEEKNATPPESETWDKLIYTVEHWNLLSQAQFGNNPWMAEEASVGTPKGISVSELFEAVRMCESNSRKTLHVKATLATTGASPYLVIEFLCTRDPENAKMHRASFRLDELFSYNSVRERMYEMLEKLDYSVLEEKKAEY